MKKFVLLVLLVPVFLGLISCKNLVSDPLEPLPLPEDRPLQEILIEVAESIKYYEHINPDIRNLYSSEDEFQGDCGDYALLFALKTGALMIIANQQGNGDGIIVFEDGIYKIVARDPKSSTMEKYMRDNGQNIDTDGRVQSAPYHFSNPDRRGIFHPEIGSYVLEKVSDYTPKTSKMHCWNILNGVEIDPTLFDSIGSYRPQ